MKSSYQAEEDFCRSYDGLINLIVSGAPPEETDALIKKLSETPYTDNSRALIKTLYGAAVFIENGPVCASFEKHFGESLFDEEISFFRVPFDRAFTIGCMLKSRASPVCKEFIKRFIRESGGIVVSPQQIQPPQYCFDDLYFMVKSENTELLEEYIGPEKQLGCCARYSRLMYVAVRQRSRAMTDFFLSRGCVMRIQELAALLAFDLKGTAGFLFGEFSSYFTDKKDCGSLEVLKDYLRKRLTGKGANEAEFILELKSYGTEDGRLVCEMLPTLKKLDISFFTPLKVSAGEAMETLLPFTANELVIIADDLGKVPISDLKAISESSGKVVFDVTGYKAQKKYCTPYENMRCLLEQCNIRGPENKLSDFLKALLDKDSPRSVTFAAEKKLICAGNFDETVEYLTKKRLWRSLKALNDCKNICTV